MDEPLAALDPVSRRRASSLVSSLNRELGVSFLIAEHDLEPLLPLDPFVVALKEGMVTAEGCAGQVLRKLWDEGDGALAPDFQKLYLSRSLPAPLSVKEAKSFLRNLILKAKTLKIQKNLMKICLLQ